MRARPPTSLPQGTRLTLFCRWPRLARSSSSCWAAAVGGDEGSSGCGAGMGLMGMAESERCCGYHPKARGCPGLRSLHPCETLPFPHRPQQGTGDIPGDVLAWGRHMWQGGGCWEPSPHPSRAAGMQDTTPLPQLMEGPFFVRHV